MTPTEARAQWRRLQAAGAELEQIQERQQLREALRRLFNACSFYRHGPELSCAHPIEQIRNAHAEDVAAWDQARAVLAAVRDGGEQQPKMTVEQLLFVPKDEDINPHQWMRNAARGKLPDDPMGEISLEIVDALQREITSQDTSWSDISLQAIIEEIIRRHLREVLV